MRREGIDLARTTLCGWVADVATALTPIGELLRRQVIAADYLQTDDTSVTVLGDEGRQLQGSTLDVSELSHHNTLYWGKLAMAIAPGDPASATDYSWMRKAGVTVAVPQAIKKPLENRVWYNYQGGGATGEGTVRRVSAIGRVLDDGTTQLTQLEYNSRGQMTKRIDPVGRETGYKYDTSGLDRLRVKQKNGASYDLLETRTYNAQHLPLTVRDAAGQTTTFTYNTAGQVLTVTNAKSDTTTYAYNTDGYLTAITGPVSGATTGYTYDALGRVRTVTDTDSYTLTYDYDTAGRRTRVTYPDSTYEETTCTSAWTR